MIVLFHDIMHKEIKVYVDYLIAKSQEGESYRESSKAFREIEKVSVEA